MPVVLILMVKNEAHIVKRCLDSAASFVDAFFILDTGSEDDTCKIVASLDYNKPIKLCHTKFQTFGISRSESFVLAKEFIVTDCGWNPELSYGLLIDADMVFKIGNFDIGSLTNYDAYKIIQRQAGLEYHNTRLIRMSLNWKCVGSTHEYWICNDKISVAVVMSDKKMWIDDVSDGGCKVDKLERDEKLLQNDLSALTDSNNVLDRHRIMFYLAQNQKCMGNYEKSIELYLERIKLGGWDEEIWCSYYNISLLYSILQKTEKTIEYGLIAYEYDPTRADPLILVSHAYLYIEDYVNALKYVNMGINMVKNKNKVLVTDISTYKYGFYELKFTILTKIPTTTVHELLEVGLNMINRTPPDNYVSVIFSSVIHQLSITITPETLKGVEGDYSDIISEKVGQSIVIYNKDRTKVYTPVLVDESYTCLGITAGNCLVVGKTGVVWVCATELKSFDIIPFEYS